eukprot:1184117-Prorocentrum_minimum.AAC.1
MGGSLTWGATLTGDLGAGGQGEARGGGGGAGGARALPRLQAHPPPARLPRRQRPHGTPRPFTVNPL